MKWDERTGQWYMVDEDAQDYQEKDLADMIGQYKDTQSAVDIAPVVADEDARNFLSTSHLNSDITSEETRR